MKIYFDYQVFYLQRYGGISRYFFELARELNQLTSCKAKIIAPYHSNAYLQHGKNEEFVLSFGPLLKKVFSNRFYNKQISVNEIITRQLCSGKKNTVLHETYYTNRISVKAPKVITIHDMIYELHHNGSEEEKSIIRQKKQAIEEADGIIAVSENTRKDLLDLYPAAKDKTFVVYHGVTSLNPALIEGYVHPRPFLLHVGNRGWYKNFELLLRVFAEQKPVHENCDLICFGGGRVTEQESEWIAKFGLQKKVHFISGSDDLLNSMYKTAAALVYISNYEGFGMPVLEAMSLSCPVLCSNTSSLPEVAGNAALMIDPGNEEELIKGIRTILSDKEQRINLISSGQERAAQFTWRKCAEQTQAIYKKLL